MGSNFVLSFFFVFLFSYVYPHSIVFIHLGPELPSLGSKSPSYIYDAIIQARLFNPLEEIYLVANKEALDTKTEQNSLKNLKTNLHVKFITIESLRRSKEHELFRKESTLKKTFRKGFWMFTVERFFVLDDFMQQYNLSDVIHLENDNLLYRNIEEILPVLKSCYKGIAAVFVNKEYCIPSFVYIQNKNMIRMFVKCVSGRSTKGEYDMALLARFKKEQSPQIIDSLPIIPRSYVKRYGLKDISGREETDQNKYCNNIEAFNSVFDGNAIGQYLGGIDPRNGQAKFGFINKFSLFNPAILEYQWEKDKQGRNIPYMIFNGEKWQINNLHIHSKNLKKFLSL